MDMLRIGCVPYLGGEPFAVGLSKRAEALELSSSPAILAQRPHEGKLDLAQISCILTCH
jgi:hypothetical protein